MNQLCKVCGEPAAGFHFGAFTCEGCKSFFGRTYNNVSGVSECKNGGRCEINKKNRTSCKSCRLRKCLQVGMSKSGSRYGRRSNWFKIHCLLSSQGHNGGMNSSSPSGSVPETNNNNSTVNNNNNNANNSNSTGVKHHHHPHHGHHGHLSSTVTSHRGGGEGHAHESDSDRDRTHQNHHHRQRSSSSGTAPNFQNPLPLPPTFIPNLSAMSPESKEQFLSTLNRKMMSPDLFEYFRSNLSLPNGIRSPPNGVRVSKPFFPEERTGDDMSRTSRSPGSLESPNSEASDEHKPTLPLFGLPPGSPLDVKPNDILSFDLLTRDLMKLGYDPVRFWPAMLTAPPSSLHSFNPYRFMFPNFPGSGAVPPGFPPSPILGNNFLTAQAPPLLNGSPTLMPKLIVGPSNDSPPVPQTPHTNRRFPLIVPPASSLTLTPPISHHGSDDQPSNLSTSHLDLRREMSKVRKYSSQDQPIDLSAKTNNNEPFFKNEVESDRETGVSSDSEISDFGDEEAGVNHSGSDSSRSSRASGRKKSPLGLRLKSPSLRHSGQEEPFDGDDESEPLSNSSHQNRKRRERRPSSVNSNSSIEPPVPKKVKLSSPLDLTRATNSNPPPPQTKVAT